MYIIKLKEELAWAVSIALAMYLAQVMTNFDPEIITDWRTWGIAVGAGAVRAVGVALALIIGQAKLEPPTP